MHNALLSVSHRHTPVQLVLVLRPFLRLFAVTPRSKLYHFLLYRHVHNCTTFFSIAPFPNIPLFNQNSILIFDLKQFAWLRSRPKSNAHRTNAADQGRQTVRSLSLSQLPPPVTVTQTIFVFICQQHNVWKTLKYTTWCSSALMTNITINTCTEPCMKMLPLVWFPLFTYILTCSLLTYF